MMRRFVFFTVLGLCVLLWNCGPTGTAVLGLKAVTVATGNRIELTATHGDGTVGQGVVKLTTNAGTLDSASVTLDSFGTGVAMVACDPVADTACLSGRVTASWTPSGAKEPIEEQVKLTFPAGTGGGSGGGGGSGADLFPDGGLRVITEECGTQIPEFNPTCCRTNQEFGKQQPRCPAVQMKPGSTFPVDFDGYVDSQATVPYIRGVSYQLTFTAPTSIASESLCASSMNATLVVDFNGMTLPVSGHSINGRVTPTLWVGFLDPGGLIPPLSACTSTDNLPLRLGYYVSTEQMQFPGINREIWKQSRNEWFFYTVRLNF